MLVTKQNFDVAVRALRKEKVIAFDTETFGLFWWQSPHMPDYKPGVFSLQFSTVAENFYFDFLKSEYCLNEKYFEALQLLLFSDPSKHWFAHNFKFDAHQLANHGIDIKGTWHCTQAVQRVVNNLEPYNGMSLDVLSKKYLGGLEKLDVVSLLKERGHFSKVKKFGENDKFEEMLHFDRLELNELVEYGERDTRLCFELGQYQIDSIRKQTQDIFKTAKTKYTLEDVLKNELQLTKVLFAMEREGLLIDVDYAREAYNHEVFEYRRLEQELNVLAGKSVDWGSAKQLKPIFDAMNEPYGYTEKGNASFDHDALEASESMLAKSILKYRYHYKRAHTYFENFIWFADCNNRLHVNFQQGGTETGRMSCWNPNLFNIPKRGDKEETKYKVRKCFIAPPGYTIVELDYKSAEFVVAIDYAREVPTIEQVKAGIDPHKALGDQMELTRDRAKTMQFRVLYGAGGETIGKALGYKGDDAKNIGTAKKTEYFERMPAIASFIAQVKSVGGRRGYIFNWFGRVLKYNWKTSFKAPNGLIQSSIGDATKLAMVKVFDELHLLKTKMVLQVYDSIVFYMPISETIVVENIRRIMTEAYPHKMLALDTDVAYSKTSWADLGEEL